jgi:cytochrome c biogenesis protein CcmG/thiol:disulfide interchange protein DsbE
VVVNVFASWCDPCKAEAPVLEQAQRELSRRGATILGVTYLDNSSDSQRFVRQQHITYPVVRDVSGSFVRSFGTTGVPETFVIDRNGRVAALRRYQLDAKWLPQVLPRVLGQS